MTPTKPDRDNPEWTPADIARATRGRPPLPEEARKQRVTLYLDRDVLETLRADGEGWQTRANATLREALGLREKV